MASIFLKPNFINNNKRNTSKTVKRIATIIGILNKRFKAIAEPKTSAKSVAIKANSKITHKL